MTQAETMPKEGEGRIPDTHPPEPPARRDRRRRRRGTRRVLAVGLLSAGLSVAIVLAVGFASFREFASSNRLREELIYSSIIREQVQQVFEDLLAAESGALGYVVTGREDFLKPLADARKTVLPNIEELTRFAWGRPEHRAALAAFARLAEEELNLLAELAGQRDNAGALSASAVLDTRRGKVLMDQIRTVVTSISRAEVAASDQRTLDVRAAGQRTKQTLLLLLSAVIAVVVGSTLVMVAHLIGRRRAELELADTLTKHRAILASARDAIITVDEAGRIETANPATARLFGWSAEELEGAPVSLLFAPIDGAAGAAAGEEGEALLARLYESAAHGEAAAEFIARRKDGGTLPVDVAIGRMRASDGNRLVAILHDISERKRAESLKNDFVSTVSHELRTPLTSISGSLGLLDGGAAGMLPDTAKRLVGIAHQNSRRLVRLVNDILDIQKMQAAAMSFAREPVAMDAVARVAMDQNAGFATEHRVRLELQTEPGDMQVTGDADRLIQVLTNLISNAVKFSPPEGLVRLEVTRRGEAVRVTVEDHGSGIPESFRASMFTPFAQADTSDTRRRGGTGLGLAIVKEIVERHQGEVSCETEEGRGTAFHVDLPAAARQKDANGDKVHP